jgi:hypothetical protein
MKKIKNILLLVSGVITGMLVYLNNITPSQACVYLGHANSLECGDTVFNIFSFHSHFCYIYHNLFYERTNYFCMVEICILVGSAHNVSCFSRFIC